jgi:hypothetical protein
MKMNIVRTSATLACIATLLLAGAAQATLVTVDQVIYENGGSGVNPGLLSGTVDVTVSGSQQLTILLQNTSPDTSFANGSQPGSMILSGLGLQLGGVNIISGTVTVNSGSVPVNFDIGQSLTDISNQWGYGNTAAGAFGGVSGVLAVNNTVSSLHAEGPTRFAGPPPSSIDGPAYGAISTALVGSGKFGLSQAAVMNTIKLVLNLDGAAPSVAAIDAADVVLGFGSPGLAAGTTTTVPDGGMTLVLLGMGLAGIAGFARRHKLA